MKKVVILGGGFGGLAAIAHIRKQIKKKHVEVTLIDKNNYSLFTPMLPEVVSGNVKPDNIVLPLREICVKNSVRFVRDKVISVDKDNNCVICIENELKYDYLIVATGSKTNFRGNESAIENALQFKSITDAIDLKYLIIDHLEKASSMTSSDAKKSLLSFSVIGGGITGVELACEMNDFIKAKIKREYSNIGSEEYSINILEYYKTILPSIDESQAQKAQEAVVESGINIINNANVQEISKESIRFEQNGEQKILNSSITVWTAGVMGRDYLETISTNQTGDKRVFIEHELTPQGITDSNIFVIGDSCAYQYNEHILPPVAPLAMQQGIMAVINIVRNIDGKPKKDFNYFHFGYLVSLGKNNSVVNLFGLKLRGRFAYYVWKMLYLYKVGMFKKQIGVFFDWIMTSWFGNESVLIYDIEKAQMCRNTDKDSK
ncbi:FAD-dependent pyridine nucleotide-disulfide oxidoreductase [Denitrovibrio acetiphilus DSM 12809]|uniref:FAD-dependent pyridine nucleotide-disulfide oxidoreductase n=1 Tax=Denitrovibrio acetiphilus (strain DSM 12809 / NBRC 114555 / N2460) TaxID=522772 RepID=D4H5R6_DENA2|nr:NAD(P)/FAD-dependent oxidoreductase [Denitrovibrio acetiphilus]ADD69507.1 FAD-dependent pyridine nucleotide-disulfide oxidoreductase [Denitrovibrio acetiphilus DSM 12809]